MLDAQVARPNDSELIQLLTKFVPVRVLDLRPVDLNRFAFDHDLTFAVLMMHPGGGVYSRFGTRDSDTNNPRMSIAGLKTAMKAVLVQHASGVVPIPAPGPKRTVDDIPAYAASKAAKEACAHCHYAHNYKFLQQMKDGVFTKRNLFQYPHPENIGVSLVRDDNNRVERVLPGSPAQAAGMKSGDVVVSANGLPVITCADLQFELNKVSEPGTIALSVKTGTASPRIVRLNLAEGWRKTDISWRSSQEVAAPSFGFWGQPATEDEAKSAGIEPGKLALKATFLFPGKQWKAAQGDLQKGDIITGVNGQSLSSMTIRQFHTWCRFNLEVGQTAVLNVIRAGKSLEISVACVDTKEE